jgi:hypothetical protein
MGDRISVRAVFLGAALLLVKPLCGAEAQVISADLDLDHGGEHPATAAVAGPTPVKCIEAEPHLANPPASCFIVAPGIQQNVPVGSTVGTSGAGTVKLTCNGSGKKLTCSARVG